MRIVLPFLALALAGCSVTIIDLSAVNSAVGDGFEARDGASTEALLLHTQRVREMDQLQIEMSTFGDPTLMDLQLLGPELFDPNAIDPMLMDPMILDQMRYTPQGPVVPL
ncbi:MAG: hypothetical protein AB8H79_18165 [Myxococcota bacterium]